MKAGLAEFAVPDILSRAAWRPIWPGLYQSAPNGGRALRIAFAQRVEWT